MTGPMIEGAEQLFDVILSRPSMTFGAASKLPLSVIQRAKILENLTTNIKREVSPALQSEHYLFPNGNVAVGGMAPAELAKRLSVKPVIVGGVDKTATAMRDLTGTIRMDWSQPNSVGLELPRKITDEQVRYLSRYFDNNQIPSVVIRDAAGNQQLLSTPIGAHIEDALFNTAKDYAKKTQRITPALIAQYKEQGVFRGQAGLLADGSPVEIRNKTGDQITVFDHTAGREFSIHQDQMSVLPTTLEDQLKPNNLFSNFLSDEERTNMVRLRQSLASGLGQKITKFNQLERLAGTRGLIANRLTKGKVSLADITSGETQTFENLGAAVAYARTLNRPMADLTPEFIKKVLGESDNIGFSGPNSGPPQFGEMIPIPTNVAYDIAIENNKKVGAGEHFFTPTRGLMANLQERTISAQNPEGIPFADVFFNVNQGVRLRQNFMARWIHGQGVPLPDGVLHADAIRKLAGKDANFETITHWLEAKGDPQAIASLEATMTPREIAAAKEYRRTYDALYKEFGITQDYLTDYAPHMRVLAQQLNSNDLKVLWKAAHGNEAMPHAMEFVADYVRTGMMDIYDMDAARVMLRYIQSGSSKRFMREPLDQVENLLHQVNDPSLMRPMNEYMLSLHGFEHQEQKEMIQRTLTNLFGKLGAGDKLTQGLVDKTADMLVGVSYMSTLAYRPASVLRNYGQVMQTLFPIFGLAKGSFMEGLGRAMTRAGKLAAVEDGAISYKSAAMFGRQEMSETASGILGNRISKFAENGFKLYDNADEYTRAASYWVGRLNAERAIQRYMGKVGNLDPSRAKAALDELMVDSKAFMFEKNIQREFIRRMSNNPESAARFIGIHVSDVSQFLYGRGMQPFWMRSVVGKFLGQYGTWPLWLADFLIRTTKNYWVAGQHGEAVKFLGRFALVNLATYAAGQEVLHVDLSRWMSYPSLFFSGGPGAQIAVGATQLFRGLSDVTAGSESPFAKSHVTEGISTLANTGLSYIPFHSAARDIERVNLAVQHGDWTEFLASMLGGQPTKGYRLQQRLDALFPGQPLAYQEFGRYRLDAPQGPSASALAEMDAYRERPFDVMNTPAGQAAAAQRLAAQAVAQTAGPPTGLSTATSQQPGPPTGLSGMRPAQNPVPHTQQAPKEPIAESTPLSR